MVLKLNKSKIIKKGFLKNPFLLVIGILIIIIILIIYQYFNRKLKNIENFEDPLEVTQCFTGNTKILLENNTYKEISNIKRNDRIRLSNNKIGIVQTILKTEINSDINICNIDGFNVKPNHPIYKIDNNQQENNWILPKNITPPIIQFIDYVYNLHIIMEDNSLPDAGFIIKGIQYNWAAMPCGHSIKYPSKNKSPFWKTHIVDILDKLEPEIDENGTLLLSKHNYNIIKNVDSISYGFRYKNKLYGCNGDRLIIYDQ